MEIIEKINALYTIKFRDEFKLLNRGDRKYYLLQTFDDKNYLFKTYPKNTNNTTKLKDSNLAAHQLSKELPEINNYIISKEYDPIVEIDQQTIGTLYTINQGDFTQPQDISAKLIEKLPEYSEQFHNKGRELIKDSFSFTQIENIKDVTLRTIEKIRAEVDESGIHYLLDNKFGVKIDNDILDLNLSHVENIFKRLNTEEDTILNMDFHFENITFFENKISNIIFDRIYLGHPYFDMSKSISRILVSIKGFSQNDLKKIFSKEFKKDSPLQNEVIDTLIQYYQIDMLYKMLINERYRENEERFTTLKNLLIKQKILSFT